MPPFSAGQYTISSAIKIAATHPSPAIVLRFDFDEPTAIMSRSDYASLVMS
jgi:hypothetical protein